jgi:hypothetical protein
MIERGSKPPLKPYMYWSISGGLEEGAVLVIAHSSREARKVGWNEEGDPLVYDYLDGKAAYLRDSDWLLKEAHPVKFANDQAHVISNPKSCKECLHWGQSPIGKDGLCESCREG